jgi:nitrogen regulatory protein P-II 1
MKRIEAVVQRHRLSKIVSALHALPHFPGFTVFDAHGQGQGRGSGGHYVYGEEPALLYHERCALVIFCEDSEADEIARTIAGAAHTGNGGDGIVVVSEVGGILRVRDGGSAP